MKLINRKGITMVSLVVTIIILGILVSITVYSGGTVLKQTKLQTITTNMMLIQVKAKTIAEQAKFNSDESLYKGTKVSNITDNTKISELINSNVIDNTGNYYLLTQNDLNNIGLQKIDVQDGYIVNYDTEEVIYVRGFENDGKVYYKLSEFDDITVK